MARAPPRTSSNRHQLRCFETTFSTARPIDRILRSEFVGQESSAIFDHTRILLITLSRPTPIVALETFHPARNKQETKPKNPRPGRKWLRNSGKAEVRDKRNYEQDERDNPDCRGWSTGGITHCRASWWVRETNNGSADAHVQH